MMDSSSVVAVYRNSPVSKKRSAETERFVREAGFYPYSVSGDEELMRLVNNHEQCDTIILLNQPEQETMDFCLSLRKIAVYNFTSAVDAGTE